MTKKTVVQKHEVIIDMDAVDAAFVSMVTMLSGDIGAALDPADEDGNEVSFADNPYYNRDVWLAFGATTAAYEKAAAGQRSWQAKLEAQRDDEVRRNGELADTTQIDKRLDKSRALESIFEHRATLDQLLFETLADRTWTNAQDFYAAREALFSGSSTNTQKSPKAQPTADTILQRRNRKAA